MQRDPAGLMLSQDKNETPKDAVAHAVQCHRMVAPAASAELDDVEPLGQQRV
jgi:hypothetical protein